MMDIPGRVRFYSIRCASINVVSSFLNDMSKRFTIVNIYIFQADMTVGNDGEPVYMYDVIVHVA